MQPNTDSLSLFWARIMQTLSGVEPYALKNIAVVAGLSMVPTFESRYALILGINTYGMSPLFAYVLAVVASMLPVPFILRYMTPVVEWMARCKIRFIAAIGRFLGKLALKKSQKMKAISFFGLFAFVAVPLPGTGVWTGSMIASVLRIPNRLALPAILAGNLTACLITTTVTLGINLFI